MTALPCNTAIRIHLGRKFPELTDRSHTRNGFWAKIKAANTFKLEEYKKYFEDLNYLANAVIGPIRLRSAGFGRQEDVI